MPTVNINRKVLEKIIKKKLSMQELKDRISMLGTDLERIDDDEIVVEVFPNRPDMLSEQGFGRALGSFIGTNSGLRQYDVKKSGQKVIVGKGMEGIRPYTVCAIVKNLKLDDEKIREIIQVQEKLHITFCRRRKKAAIGIYPLEKIKMPIHFTAKAPEDIVFRPLEYPKEINAKKILSDHPTGKEYAHLVKDLKKYAVFHDADGEILSFTPIINSHHTGKVTDATKEVFIEVSGFDLRINSYVLNILVCALADMGAEIYSMEVIYPDKTLVTPDLSPRKVKVDMGYINRWLGLELKDKEVKDLFEKMGYGYEKGHALVPAYRPDILHMVDLAEDIAIAYGYENFVPELPKKATVGEEDGYEKFRRRVSLLLSGLTMLETNSYHLSSETVQFKKMGIMQKDYVKLANSISDEYNMMRQLMIPNLLAVLGDNKHNEYPQSIYESGYVFSLGDTETGVVEKGHLAACLASQETDYTKIKQILDYLCKSVGKKLEVKEAKHPSFIDGRAAKVMLEGKEIGLIGEIAPEVLDAFGIDMPVSGFEIDLEELYKSVQQ
jgi:phenylalanyl-tRNA synthetase beta chain